MTCPGLSLPTFPGSPLFLFLGDNLRSRNIKPGFFKNDILAECSPLARILFEGLWCYADRAGRFEVRPKKMKAEILPYDNGDITVMLQELYDKGFVRFYSVNGINYGEVLNFLKHQNPHHTEKPSEIPEFDVNGEITVIERLIHGKNPADSLIPDSLIPDKKNTSNQHQYSINFLQFWKLYPRKVGKRTAFQSWRRLKCDDKLTEILEAVKLQKESEEWEKNGGEFIPHPTKWLNRAGWEDEINDKQGDDQGRPNLFLKGLSEKGH